MPHTPGPWIFSEDHYGLGIYMVEADGGCGPQVAQVLTENLETETCDQARDDARLIAAAPDLLAACKAILKEEGMEKQMARAVMLASEAIAKAEGGDA